MSRSPQVLPADFLLPDYGTGALSDLLPSVMAALGETDEDNVLKLPPAPRYVVLLVDGLGWLQLKAHPQHAPRLASLAARGRAITCGVPSTTSVSVSSIGTGLVPGRHGIAGYVIRVPVASGERKLLNVLSWDQPVDPAAFQPHPTVFERAVARGITPTVISKRRFRSSGLTQVALRGPRFVGADAVGEVVVRIEQAVHSGQRSLVYAYDSDLDMVGHRWGVASEYWPHQLEATDRLVEAIEAVLPPDAVLVVTGDHGMIDVTQAEAIDVEADSRLTASVDAFAGDARLRALHVRPGAADDVAATWAEVLGDVVTVRTREAAIAEGWFGAVEKRSRARFGDVYAATHAGGMLLVPSVYPSEHRMRGMHGSLTRGEMLVPLLVSGG